MEKESMSPSQEVLEQLQERILGLVISTTHPEYNLRRNDRHLMVDSYPLFIVRVKNPEDIIETITLAKENNWPIAVRSGGHSTRSLGAGDQSVLIDLSDMNQIEIDLENNTAKIETGATFGEVAGALQPHGLALTAGDNATVGVGGLSQGSGIGYMVRKYGLTSDRIQSADLITADGQNIHISEDENQELFWGFRGGAGNFGIATSVEFKLHPGGEVMGGSIFYEGAHAQDLYDVVRLANEAPEELTVIVRIMSASFLPFIPENLKDKKLLAVSFCYAGDLAAGEEIVAPFRKIGKILMDTIQTQPYVNLLEAHEGKRGYVGQSAYMRSFDLEKAQVVTEIVNADSSPLSPSIGMRILGGAVARTPKEISTYAHRDKPYLIQVHTFYIAEEQAPAARRIIETAWRKMAPFSEGVDVNIIGNQGPVPLEKIYTPDTLRRLVQLKQQYDPENVFHQNLNIPPETQTE